MKKLLRIMMVFMMMLGTACAQDQGAVSGKEQNDDIYVFFTSDVHCGVNENLGFAKAKALINDTKAEHENVVLVDLGDYLQGGTYGTLSKGGIIIDLMNAMEYDIVTIGNHEFDYGIPRFGELMKKASFEFTACNAEYTGSGENVFADVKPYIIKDLGGVKVAFVGVMTPETPLSSTPAFFKEGDRFVYDFADSSDGMKLAEKVQSAVDAARGEGADYVILLAHLGSIPETAPNDSISLIHHTRGIDVVLDGHSHSIIIGDRYPNADGEDVLLSSVGTKMQNLGELIISKDHTVDTVLISEYNREDEEIVKKIEEADASLEKILSQKAGTLDFDLTITDEQGIRLVRSRETNAGNFVADAIRYSAGTDAAVVNAGGVRATVSAGDVTYGNLLDVMPFGNYVSSCYCTGQQIMDALEFGAQRTEGIPVFDENAVGEYGAFLQVSGLKYTIDTSVESSVKLDEDGMFAGVEGERRVKDVYILQDGEYVPLDPEKTYTLASTEYILQNSGDGNSVFKDCELIIRNGTPDVTMLMEYFEYLGTIPDSYRGPEGRITVK